MTEFKIGLFVYSKYDFTIRGIISNIDKNNEQIKYTIINKNKNKNFNREYVYLYNQITIDPCEIIDMLAEQFNEIKNNYIDIKRQLNSK